MTEFLNDSKKKQKNKFPLLTYHQCEDETTALETVFNELFKAVEEEYSGECSQKKIKNL